MQDDTKDEYSNPDFMKEVADSGEGSKPAADPAEVKEQGEEKKETTSDEKPVDTGGDQKPESEEDKEVSGKQELVKNLDREIYEKREALRKLTPAVTEEAAKPTEGTEEETQQGDPKQDSRLSALETVEVQRREELSSLALKDITQDATFSLLSPATEQGQKNYEELKKAFERNYPNGFATKEGYAEGIKRTYAFLWPDEFAKASSDAGKSEGHKEMLLRDKANIGGTSSSLHDTGGRPLTPHERQNLDIFNQGREKAMSEEEYVKYLSESPDFDPFK